jgi:hypothetical protein
MNEKRVIQQLDKLIASGRVTSEEAERLGATRGTPAFEAVLGEIRARHASAQLEAAVADGRITPEEATSQIQRLRDGEHPKGLRARLRTHRTSSPGSGTEP